MKLILNEQANTSAIIVSNQSGCISPNVLSSYVLHNKVINNNNPMYTRKNKPIFTYVIPPCSVS